MPAGAPAAVAPALILVEVQNQWTQRGLYHALIRRELARRDVVAVLQATADAAHHAGAAVIHAPLIVDPRAPRGRFARLTRGLVFRKGSSAAAIDARVFRPGDLVAAGRTAFDAFVDSDLEALMRRSGHTRFLFGGFVTDQCVARTLATALARGFDAWLLADGCATFAAFLQRRVERRFAERIISADDALAAYRTPRATPPSQPAVHAGG